MNKKRLFIYFLSLTIGLLLWQGVTLILGERFFPSPLSTVNFLIKDMIHGHLILDVYYSFKRASIAMILSVIVAHPLGLISGQEKEVDAFISPVIQLFYPVPKIIFLPVIFLLLGLGDLSKILLIQQGSSHQV